jgi:predicted DNA-binding transcriptional regulator YafY
LEALVLGVEILSRSVGSNLSAAALALLAKIEAALPTPHSRNPEIKVRALTTIYSPEQRVIWDLLHRAISEQLALRITYLSLNEIQTGRDILPLGLFYWGGKWTLAAWCNLRQDYRDFRVDRVIAVEVTNLVVNKQDIGLRAYLKHQSANTLQK